MKKTALLLSVIITMGYSAPNKDSNIRALYEKECGSCHMSYQPRLLDRGGWSKLMDNLHNHFKTDASLEKQDTALIKEYLVKNSKENYPRNPKGEIAISKLPWFMKEHRELSAKTIQNEKIRSISNCAACHTQAAQGNYDEDNIKIPGHGKWRD